MEKLLLSPQKYVYEGFLEFFKSDSNSSPLPQAFFRQDFQKSTYATGIDYAPMNGVLEIDSKRLVSETEIDDAIQFFSSQNLPFAWWIDQQEIFEKKGFQFGGTMKGIALELSQISEVSLNCPDGLKIKAIETEQELRQFISVLVESFGMENSTAEQMHRINYAAMKNGEQIHFMASLNDVPVSIATLSVCETTSGIWNFATLPKYRGHGIGNAVAKACILEAKRHKYKQIMAILMPKGMAAGTFRKLGFQDVSHFSFYLYGCKTPIES